MNKSIKRKRINRQQNNIKKLSTEEEKVSLLFRGSTTIDDDPFYCLEGEDVISGKLQVSQVLLHAIDHWQRTAQQNL